MAAVLSGASVATAASLYSSAWILGDSLSDSGNLYTATGGAVPENPPYFEGRRSNGPVWAEYITGDFAAKGLPAENLAFAVGNANENDDIALGRPLQIPDLPQQIVDFQAKSVGQLGARPLASFWFGANDVFGAITANPTPGNVLGVAQAAANAVADGIETLTGLGVQDFLVFNLPALDRTPLFSPTAAAPLAALGTATFNATLAGRIAALSAGQQVTTIDAFALFNALIDDPLAFGVSDATNPCFIPGVSLCTPEQADERAFFDPLHPNRVIHEQIASIVREQVAPVPLPLSGLLLAGGIVALVALRRPTRA